MNPSRADWAKESNCISNPEPFSKNKPKKSEYDQICSDCPVIDLCLAHAVVNEERGIWGNTTEHERKLIRDKNLDWSHVPIEPTYQEQFERESSKDDQKLTAEEEIRQSEQNAAVQLEQLRARLALNPPEPVSGRLDSKAVSQRLSEIRNRVRGISLPKEQTLEESLEGLVPSKVLFHSC